MYYFTVILTSGYFWHAKHYTFVCILNILHWVEKYSLSMSFKLSMYLSTEVAPNVQCKEHLDLKVISVLVFFQ